MPHDCLVDILRLSFPSHVLPENRFVMNFTVYLDESGTHIGSQAVVVAGYIATADEWISFDSEWRTALTEFKIPFFHMSEFANRASSYRDWTKKEREQRFDRLVNIINAHVLGSVAVTIPRLEFASALGGDSKKVPSGPYGLAATQLLASAPKLLPSGADHWINYVFDIGSPGIGEIQQRFKRFMKTRQRIAQRLHVSGITFGDKDNFIPLQAADILAYELYRYAPQFLGTNTRPPRLHNLEMLAVKPCIWENLDHSEMIKLRRIVGHKQ